jgi:hypothetical protein
MRLWEIFWTSKPHDATMRAHHCQLNEFLRLKMKFNQASAITVAGYSPNAAVPLPNEIFALISPCTFVC